MRVDALSHELLVLLARLAHEEDRQRIIGLFRETVNKVGGRRIVGEFEEHPDGPAVELATSRTRFGGYRLGPEAHNMSPEVRATLTAAAGAVAALLEAAAERAAAREQERRAERDIEVATHELSARAETYRRVLDNLGDAVYLWHIEGGGTLTCLEANGAASRMLGYGREDFVGVSPAFLTGSTGSCSVADVVEGLLRDPHCRFSATHERRDGTAIAVEVDACALETRGTTYIVSSVRAVGASS